MARDDEYDGKLSVAENQARGLFAIARAIDGLLYGLKHSTKEGMSIAESIEVGCRSIAGAVELLPDAIRDCSPAD